MVAKGRIDWGKVNQPDIVLQPFPSRRSVVYGTKGIVSSSQPLACEAGLEILRKGGNAVDAAVATSAALNITEPSCCGIGGDAFCLFYDVKTKTIKALNGSGRAPAKLSIDYMRSRGVTTDTIPVTDLNSVTVPGAAAAWYDAVEQFGSGKVTFAEVMEPAIRLAEEGVPVSELHSYAWQRSESLIKRASPDGDAMLLNGMAPLPGQIMKFPDIGKTFRRLVEQGKPGFYTGPVAEAIVELIKSKGGVMELEDLANHKTDFVEPIKYTYANEITVYECPPNGQGITALLALGILDTLETQGRIKPLLEMEHNSPEYLHTLVEALRYYVADPDVVHVPVKELLSKEYLAKRANIFDPQKAIADVRHVIQTNSRQGGKRPYHTIIPAMALRGDELFLSYGVMGGFMQPQGHVQVLLNLLRGFTVQAALDAPRFCISTTVPDAEIKTKSGEETVKNQDSVGDINSEVYFEEGISPQTVEKLKDMGHDAYLVTGLSRALFGRGQIIQKLPDPNNRILWAAGSDLRADGHAVAQI
ncbi:hypothetical protein Clacol_003009 [Clathrus columnatus]|uniref:Gamma-glutamyltransferase n=1 Tax=Clathrus columnatus TaxID=1419009 RepID=A0AAV5A3F8_9AGAM|nr:hypothetical protein Clacol_003009 [Clathrus columnatus]